MKNFAAAIILSIGAVYAADDADPGVVYTGGEIKTKEAFKYGRFVTSIRGPVAKGTIASFYTTQLGEQDSNSIQLEVSPSFDSVVRTKVKTDLFEGEWEPLSNPYLDQSQLWHRYELDWTPQYISFKIDGREVRKQNFEQSTEQMEDQAEQYLVMQYRMPQYGEPEFDEIDDTQMPQHLELDYIEAFDYNQETESFELRFCDHFDILDQRWDTGNFTFGHTKFTPENVHVKGGRLILKMDKASQDDHDSGSDSDQEDSDNDSDSDDDQNSDDDQGTDDDSESDDDQNSDENSDGEQEASDESSEDEPEDFHILPPPQGGTLDSAIEKTTRVLVTMVRSQLENFSGNMSQHLMPQ